MGALAPISNPLLPDPAPSRICCNVFKRVEVRFAPLGGTLIAWDLQPGFVPVGAMHFYVDFGQAGTNEWEAVNALPIIDDCLAMDPQQRNWAHVAAGHYRVRVLFPDDIDPVTGHCRLCLSEPQSSSGLLSRRDWLIARTIAKRTYLLQAKRTNITDRGVLLKRRRWGTPCPRCLDWDTRAPRDPDCLECFGVGIRGGYFPAVDYTFTLDAPWGRGFDRDPQVGVTDNIFKKGWAVAYLHLDTDDVYVRLMSGERYFLRREIVSLHEVGGFPVIVGATLGLAPATDIIYQVPLDGAIPDGGSSEDDPAACGPSAGLQTPYGLRDW